MIYESMPLSRNSIGLIQLSETEVPIENSNSYANTINELDESKEAFDSILSSFKKLRKTFEKNQKKLIREDFSAKYINIWFIFASISI